MSTKKKKIKPRQIVDNKNVAVYKNILIIFILTVLVLGVSFFKAIKIKKNEHFNPARPGSLFYSETAFHYRYAQIIAEAKENPFEILRNDKFVQHPHTIDVLKYYTIMMEF
ncbi:MAG: hypothetical protein JRI96_14600, partial [Deltaproteobacteria bacterium]|nr:hypothetical protein [Deltaproteobacteria bacterium]